MGQMKRILILLALTMCGSFAMAQQVDPEAEQEIVRLVNAERAKEGLAPLQVDERLTRIAREHSRLLYANHDLSHQFPGEPDVRHRVISTGLRFNISGENVAYDADAPSAHAALMHSPPHRANILRPEFNSIGVGVIRTPKLVYVTEDFARRLPEISAEEAESEIVQSFAAVRKSSGFRPLPLKRQRGMRDLACEMARQDRLGTDVARGIPNVRTVVVWTATEPQQLPDNMLRLKEIKASGWSLGSCFASSKDNPNPVWWNVAVVYF